MRSEFTTETRGYTITLEQDLFGYFVLYRCWYGLHNQRGGRKQQVFPEAEPALREYRRICRLRLRRGYHPADR